MFSTILINKLCDAFHKHDSNQNLNTVDLNKLGSKNLFHLLEDTY